MKITQYFVFALMLAASIQSSAQEAAWWQTELPVAVYMTALDSSSEKTFTEEFEYPLLLVMDEKNAQKHQKLQELADRKAFVRHFLLGINDNPLLPANYWLMEFSERYKHVRTHFPTEEPPYFDIRGEYYLKYGKPHKRFELTEKYYFNRNEKTTKRFTKVIPNETWFYSDEQNHFNVHFMYDEEWKHAKNLRDIARRNKGGWMSLILMREFFDPYYSYLADEVRLIFEMKRDEKSITDALRQRDNSFLPYMSDQYNDRLTEQLMWNLNSLESSYSSTSKVNVSTILSQVSNLDFSTQVAQFRHHDGRTRINLTMYAPVQSLLENINPKYMNLVKKWKNPANIDSLNVEFQFMIRDSMYTPLIKVPVRNSVSVSEMGEAGVPNILSMVTFPAKPTQGDMTMQVKDLDRLTYGYRKLPFEVKDFSGDSMMISDIQFLMETESAEMQKLLPVQDVSGLKLAPYPYLQTMNNIPLFCYFEVYNLDKGITGPSYNIEIITRRVEKSILEKLGSKLLGKKGYEVGVTYNRDRTDNNPNELIALDLSELKPGRYDITVSIIDPLNNHSPVSTERRVKIVR